MFFNPSKEPGNTDLPRSPGGLIAADAQCRIHGWQHSYVAGDSGSFPGADGMPRPAHIAPVPLTL